MVMSTATPSLPLYVRCPVWSSLISPPRRTIRLVLSITYMIQQSLFFYMLCYMCNVFQLVLTDTGAVWSWGSNRHGQLGHNSDQAASLYLEPKPIKALQKVKVLGIAAGDSHSLCYTSEGVVYGWGSNKYGQLGLRATETTSQPGGHQGVSQPKRISAMQSILSDIARTSELNVGALIIQISASYNSSLLLCAGRHVSKFAKGDAKVTDLRINDVYQFGHGNAQPVRVQFPSPNTSTAVKCNCTADSTTGTCVHQFCQTVNSSFVRQSAVQVTQIACGKYHNVALSSLGQVYTWGFTADPLGHSSSAEASTSTGETASFAPQLVEALLPENGGDKMTFVNVSSSRTCVVSENGDLYCWGYNDSTGVLGHGAAKYQPIPKVSKLILYFTNESYST